MTNKSFKKLIEKEINLRADKHEEIFLINNILKPMLIYIEDHENMVRDIARISGKHIT
tara:strand:- start:123 stop:296 length:174 start_codon:yes stop_codon:yes gene_type:complete